MKWKRWNSGSFGNKGMRRRAKTHHLRYKHPPFPAGLVGPSERETPGASYRSPMSSRSCSTDGLAGVPSFFWPSTISRPLWLAKQVTANGLRWRQARFIEHLVQATTSSKSDHFRASAVISNPSGSMAVLSIPYCMTPVSVGPAFERVRAVRSI